MRPYFLILLIIAGCLLTQSDLGVAVAQEVGPDAVTGVRPGAAATRTLGTAGDVLSLGLTGERRPLYKLQKSDVVDVSFTFAPEFNQTVSVQPDGFVFLRGAGALFAEGQTLLELSDAIRLAYARTLHDPEVNISLKEFEKLSTTLLRIHSERLSWCAMMRPGNEVSDNLLVQHCSARSAVPVILQQAPGTTVRNNPSERLVESKR